MTAQASDRLRLGDRLWDIAAVDGEGLFEPTDVGITPVASSTANWRGFVCRYVILDERLLLEDLSLSSLSTLDGQQVSPWRPLLGVMPERRNDWDDLVLPQVNRPVAFSGRLLVGDGFLWDLYVHMGFHPAWRYEVVRELHLDQGRVTADVDRSQEIADVQDRMAADEQAGRAHDRLDWIEDSFSLEWQRSLPE